MVAIEAAHVLLNGWSGLTAQSSSIIYPGMFEPARHFYPQVLASQLHPLVRDFLNMPHETIGERYCARYPATDRATLLALFRAAPRYFAWAGADLFAVTSNSGDRCMIVIETNSSPSGQKSMPADQQDQPYRRYGNFVEQLVLPRLEQRDLPAGCLAVLYDKNMMEASGYAATIADLTGEPVYLVPCFPAAAEALVRCQADVLQIRGPDGRWLAVRCGFRYVTQSPWDRLPVLTRTALINPVLTCLAGGRNKLLAAKAYARFNDHLGASGLRLQTPYTICDLAQADVPALVSALGGRAVVKLPYANAGQGVYTITTPLELSQFMQCDFPYDRFIAQSLIGHRAWPTTNQLQRLDHLPVMLHEPARPFVADLRMMIGAGSAGWIPLALYSRHAHAPLSTLPPDADSWAMLGTNLSVRRAGGQWATEVDRLLPCDEQHFPLLGLSLDDLIEAFVQTVLAASAIDQMAESLVDRHGQFALDQFALFNPDSALLQELDSAASRPGRLCLAPKL